MGVLVKRSSKERTKSRRQMVQSCVNGEVGRGKKGNIASGDSLQPSQAEANYSLPWWRPSTHRKGLMATQDCPSDSSCKINPIRAQGNENTCCGHALGVQRNEPHVPPQERIPPATVCSEGQTCSGPALLCRPVKKWTSFLNKPPSPFSHPP